MRNFSSTKRAKIMALAAAGLVLGVGGTVTLAAWVDNEWVYGGTGGDEPGVGTSEFVVEQNRTTPYTNTAPDWENFPANPGGELEFTGSDPLALTPGDSTYSRVSLRTTVDSIGGNVQLEGAVAATGPVADDPGGALWAAIEVQVGVIELDDSDPAPTCDADFFADADFTDSGALGDAFAVPVPIDGAGATYLHWCFELTLPDDAPNTLQGRTIAPAWLFQSTSVSI